MSNVNIYLPSRLTPTGNVSHVQYPSQRVQTIECMCICGNVIWVVKQKYTSGHTRSCGCLSKELIGRLRRTHGLAKTRTYRSYYAMKNRCYNPKSDYYDDYGGRGVRVDERWLGKDGFLNFLTDMGNCPSTKHSLNRINNDGNYGPDNCSWATDIEQASNRRTSRYLKYRGKKYTVTALARSIGIPRGTINNWLNVYHYTDDQVIGLIERRMAS